MENSRLWQKSGAGVQVGRCRGKMDHHEGVKSGYWCMGVYVCGVCACASVYLCGMCACAGVYVVCVYCVHECVCMCVDVCACVCMCLDVCACVWMGVCMCVDVYVHVCGWVCACVWIDVCMCVYGCVHACVWVWACVWMCMCAPTCASSESLSGHHGTCIQVSSEGLHHQTDCTSLYE